MLLKRSLISTPVYRKVTENDVRSDRKTAVIEVTTENKPSDALIYSVDDVPPWHVSLLLGFQVPIKRVS